MATDYQVSVVLDGNKLIPAPFLRFVKEFQRSPDGTARFRQWRITASGKLVAFKGSPDPSLGAQQDQWWWDSTGYPPDPDPAQTTADKRLARLRDKVAALDLLLSKPTGWWFEVQPGDGSAPV